MQALPSTHIRIAIHPHIFERFPETRVGCSLFEIKVINGTYPKEQANYLNGYKQDVVKRLIERAVTPENYRYTPVCQSWQRVYKTFLQEDKKSSIESLLSRATGEQIKIEQGKRADMGKISNFVDFYNAISLDEMTSMGALDAAKISGDIVLRFGREGETFLGLGRNAIQETVTPNHVVYADDDKILTWLWNYRDAASACVPNRSTGGKPTYVLLFADQVEANVEEIDVRNRPGSAEKAIMKAAQEISRIGGKLLASCLLSAEAPQATLDFPANTGS